MIWPLRARRYGLCLVVVLTSQMGFGGQALAQRSSVEAAPFVFAPSVWLEAGLLYTRRETRLQTTLLAPAPRFGVRVIQPLDEPLGAYGALALDTSGALGVDAGVWYSFLNDENDLYRWRSHAGLGLSYSGGAFGLALSAALSYTLTREVALLVVYTHRPLFFPALQQAFDVSAGVSLSF